MTGSRYSRSSIQIWSWCFPFGSRTWSLRTDPFTSSPSCWSYPPWSPQLSSYLRSSWLPWKLLRQPSRKLDANCRLHLCEELVTRKSIVRRNGFDDREILFCHPQAHPQTELQPSASRETIGFGLSTTMCGYAVLHSLCPTLISSPYIATTKDFLCLSHSISFSCLKSIIQGWLIS